MLVASIETDLPFSMAETLSTMGGGGGSKSAGKVQVARVDTNKSSPSTTSGIYNSLEPIIWGLSFEWGCDTANKYFHPHYYSDI